MPSLYQCKLNALLLTFERQLYAVLMRHVELNCSVKKGAGHNTLQLSSLQSWGTQLKRCESAEDDAGTVEHRELYDYKLHTGYIGTSAFERFKSHVPGEPIQLHLAHAPSSQ